MRSKVWQAGRYTSRRPMWSKNTRFNDLPLRPGEWTRFAGLRGKFVGAESVPPVSFAKLQVVPSFN